MLQGCAAHVLHSVQCTTRLHTYIENLGTCKLHTQDLLEYKRALDNITLKPRTVEVQTDWGETEAREQKGCQVDKDALQVWMARQG